MRNQRVLFLFAAMGLLAGCVKEISNDSKITSLEVTIAQDISAVKSQMGPSDGSVRTLYWSNGDNIRVNGIQSAALKDIPDGSTSASFIFAQPLASAPFNLLYPASIWTDATHVTLPAIQTNAADGFADKMYPMAGYSEDGTNPAFHHLCAVVKVNIIRNPSVEADLHNIASATFMGGNNEQVSGSFSINYSTPSLSGSSAQEADLKVKVAKSLPITSGNVAAYYIVVPARTYSQGFSLKIEDSAGDSMTASVSGSHTLVAGKLYNMSDIVFIPTESGEGGADITIGSAEDLIDFATKYNDKTYASDVKVKLTADIVFDETSSATFNETKGIGLKTSYFGDSEDYYFSGQFDGNNHSISGLQATTPLFKATGSDGTVKNLTLDNTCSFTFTNNKSAEALFGSIVGYHKGTLKKVSVAANVSLAAVTAVTGMTTLGGLAGRVTVGSVEECEYSGVISTPAGYTGTGKLIIGGLVGRFSNNGGVGSSYFKGAINNAAQITSTDKSNPYLIIGGIVGHMDGDSNVSDSFTTADHAPEASAYSGFNGTIVNKTTVAYHSAVGGIAGEVNKGTVSACTNAATIAISLFRTGDGTGRYMRTGGIVGKCNASGTVLNCINNGTVQHRSNPRLQALGGIVGWNAGTIISCENNAAVNHMTSGQSIKAGRVVNLGGVIGENQAGASVTDVHNTADIQISSMEDGGSSDVNMGGVIGYNYGDLDGDIESAGGKFITNSGQVYFSPNMSNQFLGYALGGVVGYSEGSVKNVINTGYVYFRWQSDVNKASLVHIGGIVGRLGKLNGTTTANLTVSGCENNNTEGNEGKVHLISGPNENNYVGGIVGYSAANVTVSDCTNNGLATYQLYSVIDGEDATTATSLNAHVGGIMGGLLAGKTASIESCTNNGEVFFDINGMGGTKDAKEGNIKDVYVGGIIAKAAATSISDCTNAGYVHGGNNIKHNTSPKYVGGIVAYLTGVSSVLNCTNKGAVDNIDFNNDDTIGSTPMAGGIAAYVEGTSENPIVIGGTSGCSVDANIKSTRGWVGGAVGYAKYSNISSCDVERLINCAAKQAGGIVGCAQYCTISSSSFKGASIKANNAATAYHKIGGIVAQMDNTTVSECSSYVTSIKSNTPSTDSDFAGGAIVGNSASNNTINNCHYKESINGATANIAGAGSFSGTGNVADL